MSCHRHMSRVSLIFLLIPMSLAMTTTQSSSTIPPPPPISLPVYSLSVPYTSHGESGVKTSMNIVTYATAASVAPPKLWTVSLYTNTLTHHAFFYGADTVQPTPSSKPRFGVLQLLSKHQTALVDILGKHSALRNLPHDKDCYNKQGECSVAGYPWAAGYMNQSVAFHNYATLHRDMIEALDLYHVLPNCQAYLLLAFTGQSIRAGDHDVALCQVIDTGMWKQIDSTKMETTDTYQQESLQSSGCVQWASCQISNQMNPWEGSSPKDESTVLYTGFLRSLGLL